MIMMKFENKMHVFFLEDLLEVIKNQYFEILDLSNKKFKPEAFKIILKAISNKSEITDLILNRISLKKYPNEETKNQKIQSKYRKKVQEKKIQDKKEGDAGIIKILIDNILYLKNIKNLSLKNVDLQKGQKDEIQAFCKKNSTQ
jgi:L-lactate utilization protein LutC